MGLILSGGRRSFFLPGLLLFSETKYNQCL